MRSTLYLSLSPTFFRNLIDTGDMPSHAAPAFKAYLTMMKTRKFHSWTDFK